MKKKFAVLLCLAMLMTIFAVPVFAADPTVSVVIDSQPVTFDVPPMIDNGRTLVPLRAIFEKMGATVTWDDATKTATGIKDTTTVVVTIGSVSPTINGVAIAEPLSVPAKIVNGRTLAPLRFVCEAFGGTVTWDGTTYTASVVSAGGAVVTPPVVTPPVVTPPAAVGTPADVVKAAIAAFAPVTCTMSFKGNTPDSPLGPIPYSASGSATIGADKVAAATYSADMGALGKTNPKAAACPFSEIIAGPEADGLAVVSGAVLSEEGSNYVLKVTGGKMPASLQTIMDTASKDAMTQVKFDAKCDYTIKVDKASGKVVSVDFSGVGKSVTALGAYDTSFTGNATYK